MPAQSMDYNLRGRDDLSPAFNSAGHSALRMGADIEAASLQARLAMRGLTQDANGRLHDLDGRFASAGLLAELGLGDGIDKGAKKGGKSLGGLSGILSTLGDKLGFLASKGSLISVAAAGAVPATSALATSLENMAPAAGVAATGLLAVVTAGAALKIGLLGIDDGLKAAMDPSNPKAYAAALSQLAPSARGFVATIRQLVPEINQIRAATQQSLFAGLDKELKSTATSTMPAFFTALSRGAGVLNDMAGGVLKTARTLGRDGVLGQALNSATDGLGNFGQIPGQLVQGLVQVAAAAGPAFGQLTGGIANIATKISGSLDAAFESGRMQTSIDTAVSLIKDLGQVGVNVGKVLGDVFQPMAAAGGGLIGVLRDITGSISKVTSSSGVQAGLASIYKTVAVLGRTVGPLLGQALSGVGPVFAALGPPVQTLIGALGEGLHPIIAALGPVLTVAATSAGQLVTAFAPLLPVVGNLVGGLLPVLSPFLRVIGDIFGQMAPVVQRLATTLQTALTPILSQLPVLAKPFADLIGQLAMSLLPMVGDLITSLSPSLLSMGQSFGHLATAVAPVLTGLGQVSGVLIKSLLPALEPFIKMIGNAADAVADQLAHGITAFLIPALEGLAALLRGDSAGAWKYFSKAAVGAIKTVIAEVALLPFKLLDSGRQAGFGFIKGLVFGVKSDKPKVTDEFNGIVQAAKIVQNAVNLAMANARLDANATAAAIAGAATYEKGGTLKGPAVAVPDYGGGGAGAAKGPKKLTPAQERKILFDSGKRIVAGLIDGLTADSATIKTAIGKLLSDVQAAFKKKLIGAGLRDQLLDMLEEGNRKLQAVAAARKKIVDTIAAAQAYKNSVIANAKSVASITSIQPDEGQQNVTAASVTAGLQKKLADLRAYSSNIKQLVKAGLSKGMVRQIVEEGPEAAAELAKQLNSDHSYIATLNSTQSDIDAVSTDLGKFAADTYYDKGKGAGKGFLAGLEEQKAALEKQAEALAAAIGKAFRKGLGGKDIVEAALGTASRTAPSSGGKGISPSGALPVTINVNVHGASDPHATARAVHTALLSLKTARGGAALGLA